MDISAYEFSSCQPSERAFQNTTIPQSPKPQKQTNPTLFLYNLVFYRLKMNQMSFNDDLRKTKSKLKKVQVIPRVKFTEPTQKKENYMTIHNKIKVEYRNRQYKNVYEKLLKLDKPEDGYLPLYLEDLSSSVNKMLREYIVHKEVNSTSNVQACVFQGKDTISKLYRLFIYNDEVTNNRKSVNMELQDNITRFLNITIAFSIKYAIISAIQNKHNQAKQVYEALYEICSNILTSTTSNYKILRKVGQGLLIYAVYLIDKKEIVRAIKVLFDCLKNQMNLLIILSYRLKEKSRTEGKRRKIQLFNRLYAIFFNLAHCFQLNKEVQWCYLCLRECETLSTLKIMLLEKDIKINWQEIYKNYKSIYEDYIQIKKIVQAYFDLKELRAELEMCKKFQTNQVNNNEEAHKEITAFNSFQKNNKPDIEKKKNKRTLRRSVSLQQNLEVESNRRYYKDFGQELLFYGFDLFEKSQPKVKKVQTSIFKEVSNVTLTHNQISKAPQTKHELSQGDKPDSKLKKKYKKIENTLFRRIQQPIEYEKLQDRFQNMWAEQQKMNNRCKEKKYLLRYKSQYINYKQIAQENTNIYQEIQVIKGKNEVAFRQKRKTHEVEEQQKDKGIELFKKIILKHAKQLDIKKSETLNILKKKRVNRAQFETFTAPSNSVNFLLEKVKREKERAEDRKNKMREAELQKIERQRYKSTNTSNIFLTKDTVEIPNLFLSYINSSGFSCESPSSMLEYIHKPIKP